MNSERGKGSGGAILVCVILPLLLALYVLSSGPAQQLVKAGYLSEEAYDVLYAPVIFAFRNNRVCQRFLLWYDAIWR